MVREIIPRELIRHLEWTGQEQPPKKEPKKRTPEVVEQAPSVFSIDDLVNRGKTHYHDNLHRALRAAERYAKSGIVASMPYLIAGKATADKDNYLWEDWFTALTEEDVGVDKKGSFVKKDKAVLVIVHGGGILTPNKIKKAYDEELTGQNAAKFTEEEFDDLLEGKLPNGESIKLYSFTDFEKGTPDPFGRYGVVINYQTAKNTKSGYYKKKAFMKNQVVIARAGGLEHLDTYFEKAKGANGEVANCHPFKDIDSSQPQGRLLFLYSTITASSAISILITMAVLSG